MNSSLLRACTDRGRYLHVSKPLVLRPSAAKGALAANRAAPVVMPDGTTAFRIADPEPGWTYIRGVKAAARAARALGLSVRLAKQFARTGRDPFDA